MNPLQVLGLAVCIYLVYHTIRARQMGIYGETKYRIFLVLWAGVGAVFTYPQIIPFRLSESRDIGLVIAAELGLFVLVSHLYTQVAQLRRDHTRLVRRLAEETA